MKYGLLAQLAEQQQKKNFKLHESSVEMAQDEKQASPTRPFGLSSLNEYRQSLQPMPIIPLLTY